MGDTNGSSIYLISIAKYLASQGFRVHYVCPSPSVFGRWPFLWLRREMSVFASYHIRRSLRLGRLVINPRPAVLLHAGLAVLDLIIAKSGLSTRRFGRPASHSILTPEPFSEEDRAYLRRVAGPLSDGIICDYASLTPAIAAIGRPDAPTAVIMHDLFSALYPSIDEATEYGWLTAADLIVAIQNDEAKKVTQRLPGHAVVVAPMALATADQPSIGRADRVLFVASHTAPNVEAAEWLIQKVWPLLQKAEPGLKLDIAGTVSRGLGAAPDGVRMLGLVPDLDQLYTDAGVVLGPLRSGTGLKIKLIEALSRGKAVVATPVTVQGVEDLVCDIVAVADDPETFAAHVLELLRSPETRLARGQSALNLVRSHFSPERCYAAIGQFFASPKAGIKAP